MFQKVLEYAGEYRKITYLSMVVMLIGIVMNVLPFLFIYQLIRPLLLGESLELGYQEHQQHRQGRPLLGLL